ncbi:MAG TPA: PEP-CTERM sorting domain-containing protein [Caulobacteraceae bacterium]|jgi:hypothetical protein
MRLLILAAAAAVLGAGPALAAETINVPFTQADGGVTVGSYDHTVEVTVSGTGNSLSTDLNDAFYLFSPESPPVPDPQYYQLTFGTAALQPFTPSQDAVNFIVGGLPAFSSSHTYTFLLNTGANLPTQLHFGVGDGNFTDNGGAFTVTVASVPEAATWAMMLLGLAGIGAGLRLGRRQEAVAPGA